MSGPLLLQSPFFLHALINPLTTVLLTLELTRAALPLEAQASRQYLDQAITQVKHLHELSNYLRPQDAYLKLSFNVESALQEVIRLHHHPLRHREVTSILQIETTSQLRGSEISFKEALSCLVHNAFEAYPAQTKSKQVLVAAYATHHQLMLYIGDGAQGMNWLTQRLAFVPGFTQKKRGSGLGLALAKQVIEKEFQGKLSIASFVGQGSVFMISLPLKD